MNHKKELLWSLWVVVLFLRLRGSSQRPILLAKAPVLRPKPHFPSKLQDAGPSFYLERGLYCPKPMGIYRVGP